MKSCLIRGATGAIKRLKYKLQKSLTLKVGLMSEELATIAYKNEYGTEHIPPRPFMQMTFDNNRAKWTKQTMALMKTDKTEEEILSIMGEVIKSDMQLTIEKGKFVPNAPYTIRKKGKDSPLIDTGHMRDSVEYAVK